MTLSLEGRLDFQKSYRRRKPVKDYNPLFWSIVPIYLILQYVVSIICFEIGAIHSTVSPFDMCATSVEAVVTATATTASRHNQPTILL
mmetsp:Transcript_12646/g.30659  ORF Transcript_12646/g.30659 Transcript_12646/m.30659 type:complete len:88 (+) Transcript_12646:830-1093(+)